MSKVVVSSLLDGLPKAKTSGFYIREFKERDIKVKNQRNEIEEVKQIDQNDVIPKEIDERNENFKVDEENSEWVRENIILGAEGEQLVKELLIKRYGEENVKKQPDYAGYDLWVNTGKNIERIEVKTTTNEKYPFFISINELRKAVKFNEEYHIYLVIMDDNKNISIYNIKNPIKHLGIDIKYIDVISDNGICEVAAKEFTVRLNPSIIDKLDKLNTN